jgi:dolichol-phosphate mannosyltransferase
MKILVVIPTHNEKENIGLIVKEVFDLGFFGLDILIVDGESADGTQKAVKELQGKYTNLFLLEEKMLGLGYAYTAGFRYAIEKDYDSVLQMDADLSHSPEYIKDFLREIEDVDFVIGSRYLADGRKKMSFLRNLVSQGGCLYAKTVLGSRINDITGGFNMWRIKVLRAMDFDNFASSNYLFQVEIKYRAEKQGFKFKELPIIFKERLHGESKLTVPIILESFWKVFLIKWKKVSTKKSS